MSQNNEVRDENDVPADENAAAGNRWSRPVVKQLDLSVWTMNGVGGAVDTTTVVSS